MRAVRSCHFQRNADLFSASLEPSTVTPSAAVNRRAKHEDIPEVMEFIENLDANSFAKRFSDALRETAKDVISEDMSRAPERFFIARVGNKIAGIADYERVDYEYASAHVASVNVVLNAECQGKGIGKQLTDLRDNHLREEGFKYIVGRVYCDGQVIPDTTIGFFAAMFRSKTEGGRLPSTECNRSVL